MRWYHLFHLWLMQTKPHITFGLPTDWSNDQRGDFFERFVADLLRPMRFSVVQRIRFAGMEIELLAKGEDRPFSVLVECKAHRDPIPGEAISKLLGNVFLRKADAGWLFSTSDLTKEARGQWEEIQGDAEQCRKFTWYPPGRLCDILVSQGTAQSLDALTSKLKPYDVGDATLVIRPDSWFWLIELVEGGLPAFFAVFDAKSGQTVSENVAVDVASFSTRYGALKYVTPTPVPIGSGPAGDSYRAAVARVISGEGWDDPRPARPSDFVGRDDLIQGVGRFLEGVRGQQTATRTFAVQGPSGWGKSSFVLKLADLSRRGILENTSITAVDTRPALNSGFVCEAVHTAFQDAIRQGIVDLGRDLRIESLVHPLESADVSAAVDQLQSNKWIIVLIFDQFEELFSKENLFETFNAVRELSLDIDARQIPFVLGFAWKTDIALPQQHPAYHLWHQLSDRRVTFSIREFGRGDVLKVISRAERVQDQKLSPAVRARLVEQCQGLPWLLKKLLVHLFKRVSGGLESQFALLERELDVELLFKEDLSVLTEAQIRCLKYVAANSPVAVSEVEGSFTHETTNSLMDRRLLVRSGMNYVIYWDIFRDYLLEEKVPLIPWARTFQCETPRAMRLFETLKSNPRVSSSEMAAHLNWTEKSCANVLGDLVALQLVDRLSGDLYQPAGHLRDLTAPAVARHVQGQLKRHVVYRKLSDTTERGRLLPFPEWDRIFKEADPRTASFSEKTRSLYSFRLRRWLVFAGLLEERSDAFVRPAADGNQMGVVVLRTKRQRLVGGTSGSFLGTSSPEALTRLLLQLAAAPDGIAPSVLKRQHLRNAVADARTLGVAEVNTTGSLMPFRRVESPEEFVQLAKAAVLEQPAVKAIQTVMAESSCYLPDEMLGQRLKSALNTEWKSQSARRYAGGLRRFHVWASASSNPEDLFPLFA